jgi:hypothetical protein
MPTLLIDTYRRSPDRTQVGIDGLTRDQRVAEVHALLEEISGQRSTREFGIDLPIDLSRAIDLWLKPRISH